MKKHYLSKLSIPPFSNKKYSESWTVIPHQIFLHLSHTLRSLHLSHVMYATLHFLHAINATLDTLHTLHARTQIISLGPPISFMHLARNNVRDVKQAL